MQHQLYIASKNNSVKNQRRKGWFITTLAFSVLGGIFYQDGNKLMMYYFLAASILNLIFYPFYLKKYYKSHYQKFINDNYKNRFEETCTITFKEIHIETFDKTGESKINLTEIDEIIETANYFYLKMKTGGSLIIPKLKIENSPKVKTSLLSLASNLKINYTQELDWKWR
ncbi:MAG: YcxB family protein [Chitinophagaceae bacterium]|nr:YcxB family protein [Chitinophagaceae bacterium]MBP9741089.1 YcxB family protein [Chitinophagaceae bacterium]